MAFGAGVAVTLLSATPAYAHGGRPGSATSPLSVGLGIAGLVALVLGGVISSRGKRRTGLSVFVAGVMLMAMAGADIATDTAPPMPSTARVEIIEPANGSSVTSPVAFRVALVDASLIGITETEGPPGSGHLHAFVDGKVVDMLTTTEFTIPIKAGKHIVQIEFTGADHMSFEPAVQALVEVEVVGGASTGPPRSESGGGT